MIKFILYVALIIIGVLVLSEACSSDTIVEGGVGVLNMDNSGGQVLIVVERFAGKYDVGIGAITDQACDCRDFKPDLDRETPVESLSFVYVQRIWNWRKVEFGLGPGVWNKTGRVSSTILMFPMLLRWKITDKLFLSVRHFSNAGSGDPNLGQDMFTGAWRF